MTKANIIDSIYYMLRKKHDEVNHKAIIESVCNDVYNQLMYDTPAKDLKTFEFYTRTSEVAVALDADSQRYYSALPYGLVTLKNPINAIVAINSTEGLGHRFYPTTQKDIKNFDGLESDQVVTIYGYYLEGQRVYYKDYTSDLVAAGVRMSLAVQFNEFAATTEIPLPSGRDYEFKQLILDYIKQNNIIDLQIPK